MASATCASSPVLHFVDALLRGGAERLVVELATRQDLERFAPAVACFRQEAFGEELAAAGRAVHVVPKRRAFDIRLLIALVRLLRREGVALVHCHDIQSATYGTLASKMARVPAVLTVHGLGLLKQKRAGSLLPRLAAGCSASSSSAAGSSARRPTSSASARVILRWCTTGSTWRDTAPGSRRPS